MTDITEDTVYKMSLTEIFSASICYQTSALPSCQYVTGGVASPAPGRDVGTASHQND